MAGLALRKRMISGHIKADDVTGIKELTIVKDAPGHYRIYNTGPKTFIVRTSTGDAKLQDKATLDVAADTIVITQDVKKPVEGLYERIDSGKPVRGGRFRGVPSDGGKIVVNRQGTLYRILNSGSNKLMVNGIELKPKQSIDVVAKPNIVLTQAMDEEIEAIYASLSNDAARNGRFRVRLDKADFHTIIDLTDGSNAHYRIVNAGNEILKFGLSTAPKAHELKPKQSLDFLVPAGGQLGVSPDADNTRIQGIYEFLGSA